MKERPILFSGAMVRAILEGRKTMTRRVVTNMDNDAYLFQHEPVFKVLGMRPEYIAKCPYGQAGDRLWVRETFRLPSRYDDATPDELAAQVSHSEVRYLADGDVDLNGKTRPAIFLRYGWHRIVLEVVSVRVERVQDISEEDAECEGVETATPQEATGARFRVAFRDLWNSINAKRGYGWHLNPWVWVVEFKHLKVWP